MRSDYSEGYPNARGSPGEGVRPRGLFKRLLDPADAISAVTESLGGTLADRLLSAIEEIDITDLHGRLLAEYVVAPRSLPWYPRSLVDGCAVRSIDVEGAFEDRKRPLKVEGRVKIGTKPRGTLREGTCFIVDTGSWVPVGADAVVPVEYIDFDGDIALVSRSVTPGANIAAPASDVAQGDVVAAPRAPWSPMLSSVLAALGIRRVKASRRPVVAIFSTGDELVEAGNDPGEAGIFDSNRPLLHAFFRAIGWQVLDLGIARDSIDAVKEAIARGLERGADIIVASGGTSAGVEDVVYRAVSRMGRLVFHGLRLKPGKPTLAGIVGGRLVLGLPGNPRSAANVLDRFVIPLLDELGLPTWPSTRRELVEARTVAPLAPERGRDTIIPVSLAQGEPVPAAIPVARDSYMIASTSWSDGEVIVSASFHEPLPPGSPVKVQLYRSKALNRLVIAADMVEASIVKEALARYKAHPVYYPTPNIDDLLKLLPPITPVIASALSAHGTPASAETTSQSVEARGDVEAERVVQRQVYLYTWRDGKCGTIAIPRVYSPLLPLALEQINSRDRVIPVGVPRIAGALTLLQHGYVDCALLPSTAPTPDGIRESTAIAEESIVVIPPRS